MKKTRGELTTQQIVILIILLVSFIIILYLLFRLDLGGESDSEVCYNSVVLRGSSVLPTEATPLKCSRTYLCITEDGTCEGMTSPEIEKVKTEEEVYSVLASEMANCWWMFGEGKIDYVTNTMTKDNYCSICSQIVFDNSLTSIKDANGQLAFPDGNISKDYLYSYLAREKIPDENLTYAQYFLGTNNIEGLKKEFAEQTKNGDISFGKIKIGEQYFVVMGITTNVNTLGWVLSGAAAGGALVIGLATVGIGTAGFVAVLIGETAVGGVGGGISKIADMISPEIGAIMIEGDGIENQFMTPTIQEANSDSFAVLNCNEVVSS